MTPIIFGTRFYFATKLNRFGGAGRKSDSGYVSKWSDWYWATALRL